jgi:hypothetical protein
MIAWMLRFKNNCRKATDRVKGELTVQEFENAERKLLKMVQEESFDTEDNPKLKSLCTFKDQDGLIRLKTKITRRNDEEDFKCPIVLPSEHKLVEMLIRQKHLQLSHAGVLTVLCEIRQQFWILRGRKTIRKVIRKCTSCLRYNSKHVETSPTPLPEDRVRDALVFEVTGVDLAGPLYLKNEEKAWILLFTCAVYRAVHLELILSLSTNSFLQGLRRFIARRGRPKIIYSDHGSNFVGADNLFKNIDWNKIAQDISIEKIQWKFNPPTAAWWGGWWERLIQMVKKLLRRVLGRSALKYEEMCTVLCDVEAVINARPLTYLSEDVKDMTPLTPATFLQNNQSVGVPDLDHLDEVNLTKRYKYQQRLREEMRKRFREEYLGLLILQQSQKKQQRQIRIGDVVLIGCDNKKRLDWPLGRVIEIFPGRDQEVRVVKVKTSSGELIRPIQRVYPLEISQEDHLLVSSSAKESDSFSVDREKSCERKKTVEPEKKKTRSGRVVIKPSRFDE